MRAPLTDKTPSALKKYIAEIISRSLFKNKAAINPKYREQVIQKG